MFRTVITLSVLLLLISGCKRENYYYRAATGRIAEKNYTQATWLLERGIEQDSRYYNAYHLLIEIHATRRTLHEAIDYFNRLSINEPDNPYPDLALGMTYQRQGFYREAAGHYRESLQRDSTVYQAYEGLVEVTFRGNSSNKRAAEELWPFFEGLESWKVDTPAYYYGIGHLYRRMGRPFEAASSFKLAVHADWNFVAAGLKYGEVMFEMKNYYEALDVFERTLELSKKLEDRVSEARSYYMIALTYNELADYPRAIRNFVTARGFYHELGLRGDKALTLASIGLVYKNRSEYSTAISYCERASALQRLIGDREGQRVTLTNLALIYNELGQYQEAIGYYKEQLALSEFTGDKRTRESALGGLGRIYSLMEDYNQAFGYYEEVLALCRENGSRVGEGETLYNMGNLYFEQGEYEEALACYNRALTMHALANDRRSEAGTLYAVGLSTYKISGKNAALDYFYQAINISKKLGNRLDEAEMLHNLGLVFIEMEDYYRAKGCFLQALSIRREIGNREGERDTLTEIGNIFFKLEDYGGAYDYYKKAIEIVERVRSDLKNELYKTDYLGERIRCYENIIVSLYALHNQAKDKGYDREAFLFAERSKARGLLDLLTESSAGLTGAIDPELLLEEKRLERKYSEVNTALQLELARPESDEPYYKRRTVKLAGYLDTLEKRLSRQRLRIIRENPRYAQLRYPKAVPIEKVQESLLKEGMVQIEYKMTDTALYAWCITADESRFYRMAITKEELRDRVLALRNCFTGIIEEEFFYPRSYELFELLLKPILEDLKGIDSLLIVPDGILHYLPFETLVTKAGEAELGYRELSYLIKRYKIRYSPSSTVAYNLLDKEKKRPVRELFAMGDPVFLESSRYGEDESIKLRGGSFRRLLFSGEEVKKIGSLFDEPSLFIREKATEEELKAAGRLEEYRYIHLAAHGILNENNPQLSGIVLSQDYDPQEDGFLQTREIFNLKLSADLVVLSACRTGMGKIVDGEGIVGLTRAWMYAGTESLVVSLWSVNDRSTSYLMEEFYKNIRYEQDFSRALRGAKLNLIEQGPPAYSNPYFWAGFVLLGKE